MKVTSRMLYAQVVKDLDKNSEKLLNLNSQISSGKRINSPGDDPLGMASVLTYRGDLNGLSQYQKAITYAKGWQSQTDSILQDMDDNMGRALELATQASSDSATAITRLGSAEEIKQLRELMLGHANEKYGGKYMFSGTMTQTKPFLDLDVTKWQNDVVNTAAMGTLAARPASAADGSLYVNTDNPSHAYQYSTSTSSWADLGAVTNGERYINTATNDIFQFNSAGNTWTDQGATAEGTSAVLSDKGGLYVFTGGQWESFYQGNDSTFSMQIGKGDSVQTNIPGSTIFTNSSGDIFMTLMKLERALRNNDQAGIQAEIPDIQNASQVIYNNLAGVGARMNRLDHTSSVIDRDTVSTKASMSKIEDLDYAEGITSLQNQQTIYQAALKSVAMITSLSLVDFIQ